MAFTNKGGTSGDITNVTSSSDTVASIAVPDLGANRVGVVHVITNHLNPVTGVTWGGVAMTEQWDPRQINDTGNNRIATYYLVGCGHNTTLDVVVTYGGSQIHSTHVAIIWASAGGTITIDDFDEAVGTGTASPSITSTQTAADELVVSCSAHEAAAIAATPVTDCTLHSSRDFGAWCAIVAYSIPAASGAVTHIHNYSVSDAYVIQSMSFQEAGGPGAGVVQSSRLTLMGVT